MLLQKKIVLEILKWEAVDDEQLFCEFFLNIKSASISLQYLSLIDMLLLGPQRALAVSKKNWRMVSRGPSVMNPFCIDKIPAVVKTISKSSQEQELNGGARW